MRLRVTLYGMGHLSDEAHAWISSREQTLHVAVDRCRDFAPCLEAVARRDSDILLVDQASAPEEARLETLRASHPDLFCVLLTPDREGGEAAGFDAVLPLPLEQGAVGPLFDDVRRRRVQAPDQGAIRELWEISKAIASGLGTTRLLEMIVDSAIRVTAADAGSVMLVSQDAEHLYVAAAKGPRADVRRNKTVSVGESVAGWVARTGEPLILQGSLTNDDRFLHLASRDRIKSSLCVPIKAPDQKLLGVLSLNMEETENAFATRHLHLMTIYAAEAAAIIASSRAFDELQSANQKLKRTNERLKTIQAQLVQSSKMAAVGLLASGIAHEFNNLLTGILGMAQLAQHTKKDKHVWKAIEVSEVNSQKAKDIIKNLLKFSGRYKKVREQTAMGPLVEEVLSLMAREFEKEGIVIQKSTQTECQAPVNRSEIQQVVLNLLINAKQAIEGPGQVDVGVRETKAHVLVEVRDTGCGIPEENLSRIFEPFFSTKSLLSGGGDQGTGLGLSVSYGIVQGHGGAIEVESVVGEGTAFLVRIPKKATRTRRYTDSIPKKKTVVKGSAVLQDSGAKQVVIIDDEWWIREFLKETLDELGYQSVAVEGAHEGLDAIRDCKPDLVFLDLILPGERGEDLANRILEEYPDTSVVLMTGNLASLEAIEKNIERGIYAYLSKPFDVQDVVNLLNLDPAGS